MKRIISLVWLMAALLMLLAGCGAPRVTLTVLAGSELQDLEPLLPLIERQTGVRLKMEYTGTLTGVEKLLGGAPYDLAS